MTATKPATPLPYGAWPGYSVRTVEKSANGVDVEITSMTLMLDGHTAAFQEATQAVYRANAYPRLLAEREELVKALRELLTTPQPGRVQDPAARTRANTNHQAVCHRARALLAKLEAA